MNPGCRTCFSVLALMLATLLFFLVSLWSAVASMAVSLVVAAQGERGSGGTAADAAAAAADGASAVIPDDGTEASMARGRRERGMGWIWHVGTIKMH